MSDTIICNGCGQRVEIPPGYQRNKIQCPNCGVICQVPAGAARAPAPGASRTQAPAAPKAIAARADTVEPVTAPAEVEQTIEDVLFRPDTIPSCPKCGRKVNAANRCPVCHGGPSPDPPIRRKKAKFMPPEPRLQLDDPDDEESDGNPYDVQGGLPVPCPNCHAEMEPNAVVCVSCGFNRQTRKKLVKTYEPMRASWESSWSFQTRLLIFLSIQGGSSLLGLLAAALGSGELIVFSFSWCFAGCLLAFLLGTFDKIDLARDRRGRVELFKTWRLCFLPMSPMEIPIVEYEGIVCGKQNDAKFWEWVLFLCLLISGILPGLIFWYFTIHRDRYFVALCRDHGFPETKVYLGFSEAQMHDIAEKLRDASGLAYSYT
jgi:hypothetical protein